jgi:death-on-curing protein
MRFLTTKEVSRLHERIIERFGGSHGFLNPGALESALANQRVSFGGNDLYPTLADKAAALCFSIIRNHPFVDGNKRTGHAAMEVFLVLNGHELTAPVDEAERIILDTAVGTWGQKDLAAWVSAHIAAVRPP